MYCYLKLLTSKIKFSGPPVWDQELKCKEKWKCVQTIYRGSYTSGQFIRNLRNKPLASFINFTCNEHECMVLFIIKIIFFIVFKMENISRRKRIVDTDIVSDITSMHQSIITHVDMCCLWHNIIHWITATTYDKLWSKRVLWDISSLNTRSWNVNLSRKCFQTTLKCLKIGTPKAINFPFVPNGKLMFF